MKRKERRVLGGIEEGALYVFKHSDIPGVTIEGICCWLNKFWEATGFWNVDRIKRICKKDTEWIAEQIQNRVNPRKAATEYKKTHM